MATQVQRFSEGAYIITETGEEIPVYEGMELLPTDTIVGDVVTIEVDVVNDPGADPSVLPADITELQQLILEGADPTQVGESTAAGATGAGQPGAEDGGGSSFVTLDRVGTEVDPTSGYDTIPINFFVEEINEELPANIGEGSTDDGFVPDTAPPSGPNPGPEQPEPIQDQPEPEPEEPEQPEEPKVEPPVEPPTPEEPEEPEEEDNSGQNNGWGNGDQDAPGNSEDNNNAENSDNDPPPGIRNNPNLGTDDKENTEDEEAINNDSSDSDTFSNDDTTDEDSGSDTLNPNDLLDEEDDTIPGLGRDNPNAGPKGNNGWGNGDQDAPGNSLDNNNAENNLDGLLSPTEQYYENT